MSCLEEPPCKKLKTPNKIIEIIDNYVKNIRNYDMNLEPVLSDELYKPIPLTKMYVGHLRNVKDISKMISILNEKAPLTDYQHLKRARQKDIIICPTDFLTENRSIRDYLDSLSTEFKDAFEYIKLVEVASIAPKLKKQYLEVNKVWSCNFHPDKNLEYLISGSYFTPREIIIHRTYMIMAFEVCKWYLKDSTLEWSDIFEYFNATIVVDPIISSVVAIAFDNRKEHPLQHSIMLAIDNVAKTQHGGAWVADKEELDAVKNNVCGIDESLMKHLKTRFPNYNFGSKFFKKEDVESGNRKDLPYLCTGYYVYTIKEPCVMCSMALVHARAKRIMFCLDNAFGGLKTLTRLQEASALNHHFDVFTGFLAGNSY